MAAHWYAASLDTSDLSRWTLVCGTSRHWYAARLDTSVRRGCTP
ncbi:MAG: hypothetical protein ACTFAL_13065 [Candidatus Electronema sp. V4]